MEAHRFEPFGNDLNGLWNVSSSIDWCERNYVVSYYVAEFWNTVSAAIIFFCGLIDLYHAINMGAETRFKVYSLSVMMVGIGTATFHGSLTFIGQLGDELPMVWCMMTMWYIMMVMETKESKTLLPIILGTYCVLFSAVHAFGAFHRLFQVHFALLIGVTLIYAYKHMYKYGNHPALWPLAWYYLVLWAFAFTAWLTDQFMCESMHSLRLGNMVIPNPQGHAFWHILTGLSTHVGMIFVRVMRYMAIYGEKPNVYYIFGFWPTVNDLPPKSLLPKDLIPETPFGKTKSS